jgi:hypothetical protein
MTAAAEWGTNPDSYATSELPARFAERLDCAEYVTAMEVLLPLKKAERRFTQERTVITSLYFNL